MNKYSTFNVSQRNHIDMYFYFHKLSHKKRGKIDILKLSKHDIAMIIQQRNNNRKQRVRNDYDQTQILMYPTNPKMIESVRK